MSDGPEGYSTTSYSSIGEETAPVSSCGAQVGGGVWRVGGPKLWRKTLNKYRENNPDLNLKQQLIPMEVLLQDNFFHQQIAPIYEYIDQSIQDYL